MDRSNITIWLAITAGIISLNGCGNPGPATADKSESIASQPAPDRVQAPAAKERPVESPLRQDRTGSLAQETASIAGIIRYEGPVPGFKEISMSADPICAAHHAGPVMPQTLVLGGGGAMADVFVHITGGLPSKQYASPADEVVLNQAGCMYDPHVLGVMVGQTLKILNPDGTLHNVHAGSTVNPAFNAAMPKFRTELKQVFAKAEFMFPLKCDVHPWMGAWIAVMTHPYFDVTSADGRYAIERLAPGIYEVEAWHEKLGTRKVAVTLAAGEKKEIDFTFVRPEK